MILRRLAQNLREQNWTAITLEFVLLVAGVFLGIQVANWNEERLQAREGALYTARLKVDLRNEHHNWQTIVAYFGDVRANAEAAAAILEGKQEATDEALLIHAYRATQYMYSVRWRATWEELTSTGSLGLIESQALRDTAAQFYLWPGIENAIAEGSGSAYRGLFRRLLPIEVQDALTQRCGDRLSFVEGLGRAGVDIDYACETGLTAEQIAAAGAALRDDPEVLPALRLRAMNVRSSIADLTDGAADIAESLQPFIEASP